MSFSTITVVGSGAWGTAVSHLLAQNCSRIYLWGSQRSVIDDIRRTGQNNAFLPNIQLHENVQPTNELSGGVTESPLLVWAIPVQFLRSRIQAFAPHLRPDVVCINLGKGIEEHSLARPSSILRQECTSMSAVGSLVGPNIASEVASGLYAEATLGLSDATLLEICAAAFATPTFRVHTTTDIDGIEVFAALKNVCAIAAGLCDGLGLGANTKSLVIAACLEEIRRLGMALGAQPRTFVSRCTIGDLLTSCYSESGRNRRLGEYLGQGYSLREAVEFLSGRIAEGVATCRAIYSLRSMLRLSTPVVENLHDLIEGRITAMVCVQNILVDRIEPSREVKRREPAVTH